MFPIPKGPLSELADQREAVGGFVFLVLLFPPSWKRCSERPGVRQGHGERRGNAPRAVGVAALEGEDRSGTMGGREKECGRSRAGNATSNLGTQCANHDSI